MPKYKVINQAIAYNGQTYYPERKVGDKKIPADVVEMSEEEAKAYGKDYLVKISKGEETKEKKEEKSNK